MGKRSRTCAYFSALLSISTSSTSSAFASSTPATSANVTRRASEAFPERFAFFAASPPFCLLMALRMKKYRGTRGIQSAAAPRAPLLRYELGGAATEPKSTPASSSLEMSFSSGMRFVCKTKRRASREDAGGFEDAFDAFEAFEASDAPTSRAAAAVSSSATFGAADLAPGLSSYRILFVPSSKRTLLTLLLARSLTKCE